MPLSPISVFPNRKTEWYSTVVPTDNQHIRHNIAVLDNMQLHQSAIYMLLHYHLVHNLVAVLLRQKVVAMIVLVVVDGIVVESVECVDVVEDAVVEHVEKLIVEAQNVHIESDSVHFVLCLLDWMARNVAVNYWNVENDEIDVMEYVMQYEMELVMVHAIDCAVGHGLEYVIEHTVEDGHYDHDH